MSEDKRLDEIIWVKGCRNNFVMMDKSFLEGSRQSDSKPKKTSDEQKA